MFGQTWISPLAIPTRLIALVLAAVLPMLGLLVAASIADRSHALQSASDEVLNYARLTAERQSRVFDDARIMLSTLKAAASVSLDGSPACDEALSKIAAQNRQFMTIGVVRGDGTVMCHNFVRNRIQFGDLAIVQAALKSDVDDFLIGGLLVGPVTGKPTIIAASPMSPDGATVGGIVFASIDLSGLSAIGQSADGSAGKRVMIVDAANAKVIAATGAAETLIGKSFAGSPLIAALRAAPKGGITETRGLSGEYEILGFAPLRAEGVSRPVVVVGVAREAALADANGLALSHLALAFGVAACALIATWLLGYSTLVKPIRRLSAAADRFGEGDLLVRAKMESWQPREMRSLAATMNQMAERLDGTNKQLETLANEDGLTGLANRRRFDDALATECRRAERLSQPLALLLIDVDFFKSYNDIFGHLAGDDCLKRLAGSVKASANRPGDLAARYGGEELAVILPDTGEEGAVAVARNVLRAIDALGTPHPGDPRGVVSVSIGVSALACEAGRRLTPDLLIRSADDALYEAKSAGRSRYCVRRSGKRSFAASAATT